MRTISDIAQLTTLLIGTGSVGETHYGAPIDTLGYTSVTAIVLIGAVAGTNGNTGQITVKFQEGLDPAGTGTQWADITDGALQGSFKFAEFVVTANSSPLVMSQLSERLDSSVRKRYIRPHISVAGTDSVNPHYAVGVLLDRAADSELYITSPGTFSTGNADYS